MSHKVASRTLLRNPCIFLFAAVLACCPAFAASTSTVSARTAARAGNVSDAQIEATISAKLAKSKIGKDGFKFHVQKGVVTWEGATSVVQHKGSATRMARTAGAMQVVNNIKINGAARGFGAGNVKKAQVSD